MKIVFVIMDLSLLFFFMFGLLSFFGLIFESI